MEKSPTQSDTCKVFRFFDLFQFETLTVYVAAQLTGRKSDDLALPRLRLFEAYSLQTCALGRTMD